MTGRSLQADRSRSDFAILIMAWSLAVFWLVLAQAPIFLRSSSVQSQIRHSLLVDEPSSFLMMVSCESLSVAEISECVRDRNHSTFLSGSIYC